MTILRALRMERRLPIVEVAFHVGMDDGTYSKAERGFKRFPERVRERVAGFFGVEQGELFEESGYARKN
jgi:transcriptional regulator with XRE-family HTH domain